MHSLPEVVVVGDVNVDIVVHYPKFLDFDRKQVEFSNPELVGGGTSSNTAHALARLGMPCCFIGTVGDDPYGRFARDDLAKAGVDVSTTIVDESLNTVGVFAFVDDRGERYLWGWPRERQSFKVIDEAMVPFDRIRGAGWVHSSGMSLTYDTTARSSIIKILEVAHSAGVPTSFDLNLRIDDGIFDLGFSRALDKVVPNVSYLLGSGPDEFAYLGSGSWEDNARDLAVEGRVVIARDGGRGCVGFADGMRFEVPAYQVSVEDTVGAGDDYNAGFICSLLSGGTLEEAMREGNAVSGYAVERKGARNTPDQADLAEFVSSHAS